MNAARGRSRNSSPTDVTTVRAKPTLSPEAAGRKDRGHGRRKRVLAGIEHLPAVDVEFEHDAIALQVGAWQRQVRVLGPRRWDKAFGRGVVATPSEPFRPTGPPIASKKWKWLGNVHAPSQLEGFAACLKTDLDRAAHDQKRVRRCGRARTADGKIAAQGEEE